MAEAVVAPRGPFEVEVVAGESESKTRPASLNLQLLEALLLGLRAAIEGLLCDEPTGNLDTSTGKGVVSLLRRLVYDHHKTVIVVTHDESIARSAAIGFHIQDGRIRETR